MTTQKTKYRGLTPSQVEESRRQHGANLLTPPQRESLWSQFLQKFSDPLIRILLVALLLSLGVSCYEFFAGIEGIRVLFEPVGIFVAIALATGVGFWLEVKANRAFDILVKVNDDTPVKVIRDAQLRRVPKRDVVVGDIVLVETGDEIPADGQLLEAVSMQVNESTLTGEPLCRKSCRRGDFDSDATYPTDRLLRGTTVTDGHGVMQVERVGDATEYGKVYVAAQIEDNVKTPLNEQLDRLGHLISVASYVVGLLVIAGRLLMFFSQNDGQFEWIELVRYSFNSVMIAVTLVVVSVPEGLPMSVTLSLALSMRKMLQTNNLVRRMHACETMGATSVICTDKTGTLTRNRMSVRQARFCGQQLGTDAAPCARVLVREAIAVNSTAHLDYSNPDAPAVLGNPTEGALLLWLAAQGDDYIALREAAPVAEQLTFSTERKYMATCVQSALLPGKRVIYIKGASDILLPKCRYVQQGERMLPAAEQSEAIFARLAEWQAQAMRTLGFAYKILDEGEPCPIEGGALVGDDFVFMGIAAIADPVRDDVPAAVDTCRQAGIRVVIVTGDTPGTAREVARQIGIWSEADEQAGAAPAILTGPQFAELGDEELRRLLPGLKILSRARPMDKERLVGLLQSGGEVVAVTGDGTNDAPALKRAQVGLSMGDGTSVAKEASDITIIDNSFASIGRAVMWGRSLYKNIQRFIIFQLTVNVAASLVVLVGAFMGTEAPLTVTQMLWVNLIMDTFAALALAALPPDDAVMRDKPRRRGDFIINRRMAIEISASGLLFFALQLVLLNFFKHSDVTALTWETLPRLAESLSHFGVVFSGVTPYEESLFFTIFVMMQFWNLFNVKAAFTRGSAFAGIGRCPAFVGIAAAILVGQVLIVEFGGAMFNVTPLTLHDWLVVLLSTSLILWGRELAALFKRKAA